MNLGFHLALIADLELKKTFEKQLAALPLTPFAIPGLVSVGPELSFGVGAELGFEASAGVLAGVDVSWPAMHMNVDLKNKGASGVSGMKPGSVSKTLSLSGQVTVSGEIYLYFGLEFGIE